MLKHTFSNLVNKYTADPKLAIKLWNEIVINYSDAGRYFHNMKHLENMYNELLPVKDKIEDWDTLLFSLFYHDIIYKTSQFDNEAESADLAKKRLQSLNISQDKVSKCVIQILATKGHSITKDCDTNFFIDADLAVIGQPYDIYSTYNQHIRNEYFIYPDLPYKKGRKAVLKHFLNMPTIFKTEYFQKKYESQARENLTSELQLL